MRLAKAEKRFSKCSLLQRSIAELHALIEALPTLYEIEEEIRCHPFGTTVWSCPKRGSWLGSSPQTRVFAPGKYRICTGRFYSVLAAVIEHKLFAAGKIFQEQNISLRFLDLGFFRSCCRALLSYTGSNVAHTRTAPLDNKSVRNREHFYLTVLELLVASFRVFFGHL